MAYLQYGDNNWVSYDDPKSFQMKIDYANNLGLGGLMIWAVDMDNSAQAALQFISPVGNNRNVSLEIPKDTCTSGPDCGFGKHMTNATSTSDTPVPSPVRDGMAADCNAFYLRKSSSTMFCADIAKENKISVDQFYKLNPAVKSDCSGLWPDYYYCVGAGSSKSAATPTTRPSMIETTTPSPVRVSFLLVIHSNLCCVLT